MAQTQITGTQIKDNDLTFDDLADGSVRGSTGNGGVQRELATGTVSDVDIRNSAVTPLKVDSSQAFTFASATLSATTNQLVLGTTTTTTITAPTPAANRIVTIPDVGGSSSTVMTEGTQTINGSKRLTQRVTLAVAGHNDVHWDWNMYSLDNNDQYGMFLSGSNVQLRVAANATLDVAGSTLTIAPIASPSTTFNVNGFSLSGGTIKTANGTAGAPTYSFTSGTGTGTYAAGTNILAFSTNSTEAMRIDTTQSIGIGGAPVTNGILTISSTTKAFVPPRMTTTQRDLITPLTAGMTIYNSTTNELNVYNGTTWIPVGSTAFPLLGPDGTAGAPSYSFTNDTDIGMFRQGTNALSFSTNATEAIRIDATQSVDFLQHEAKQLVVHKLASDPGSPVEGQIWYNTTTKQWVGYNGTTNVVLG